MRRAFALLALVASSAGAQTTIATFGPGPLPPLTGGAAFARGASSGQGFYAPAGATSLTSLRYWFRASPPSFNGGGAATFSLFRFDGTQLVGPALATEAFTFPTATAAAPFTFTPGVAVMGGDRFIALISTNEPSTGPSALFDIIADSPANATGDAVYYCAPGPSCVVRNAGNVAVFDATFAGSVAAVPEPGTLVLGLTGLVGVALLRRMRRA